MHINNWVHASDLMKRVKSANSISTLSSEEGLPDNHVITIRERELTVDFPELIQNNIKTDTVTLDLDAEWDGIQPVIIFGPNADGTIAVEYTGEPVHIPGAVMQYVGGLDCSVMGLDDSGEVRLVTKAAPNTFEVVESGEYIGQISEDDVSLLGQILSAIKDAETATSDASSAAEDATAAADSANTAAAKATNAANSANTAATKATAAANSANTASERAENAYDVLTPIIAEIGVNGNQPRATTNPNYVATASDAYAAKPLEICIKGKTWVNRWPVIKGTIANVTVSTDDTGLITITGSFDSSASVTFPTIASGMKANTVYTCHMSKALSWDYGFYIQELVNGVWVTTVTMKGKTTHTFTTNANATSFRCGFQLVDEGPINETVRVMLVDGTEAPDCFTPCASITSVQAGNLVTAGKNLLPPVSEWNVGDKYYSRYIDNPFPIGTQLVGRYGGNPSGLIGNVRLEFRENYDSDDYSAEITPWSAASTVGRAVTVTARDRYICIFTAEPADAYFDQMQVQLELGSTATAYEPPNVTTTPIDLDGNTLCSLPDGTHDELTIDATGAVTLVKRVGVATYDGSPDEAWRYTLDRIGSPNGAVGSASIVSSRNGWCDTLPVRQVSSTPAIMCYDSGFVDIRNDAAITNEESGRSWLASNPTTLIYPLAAPETISLPPVTLPTLPSPNITVYHDSDVPSDITVEYVQDINIVLDNLNAKIAALNVAQSISS